MKFSFEERARKAQFFVFSTAHGFEVLVALIVIIAIVITLCSVPTELIQLSGDGDFNNFLVYIFNIIIGIELLKMLCRHDLDSVVEVLLFAVAREMIIRQMPIYETLTGIVAIAILFLIRKFLFVSALDKQEPGDS